VDLSTEEDSRCIAFEVEAAPAGGAAEVEEVGDQPKGTQWPAQNLADTQAVTKSSDASTVLLMPPNTLYYPAGDEEEGTEAVVPAEEEEEDQPKSKRRRRRAKSSVASLDQLRERWHWLADIKTEDKPWIFFAMHRAYHSKVTATHCARSQAFADSANGLQYKLRFGMRGSWCQPLFFAA